MSTNGWEEQLKKTAQLYARVISPEEFEIWGKLLSPIQRRALVYAFENWQRNGRYFCKPIDIIDLIEIYKRTSRNDGPTIYEHHGQGYGQGDMLGLWKLVSQKSIQVARKLTEAEIWQLLDVVDAKRPSGPADFRRTSI